MVSLKDLLQFVGVREELSKYLTYRDSVNVRKALDMNRIDCPFPVIDKDGMIQLIPFSSTIWDKLALTVDYSGSGYTWLKAGKERNYADLQQLVQLGFDVNNQTYGYQYLYVAILEKNLELLHNLLDLGIQLSKFSETGPIAIISESCEMINLILDRGIDVNDSTNGISLLMRAAMHGNLEIVNLLLERGADPKAVDRSGKTVLDYTSSVIPEIITRLKEIS